MAESDPSHQSEPSAKVHDLGRLVETGAQKLHRLQEEAHALAREQIQLLVGDLNSLAIRSGEIAEGGEAYPVGARELCSRLVDELTGQAQSLLAIMERIER